MDEDVTSEFNRTKLEPITKSYHIKVPLSAKGYRTNAELRPL